MTDLALDEASRRERLSKIPKPVKERYMTGYQYVPALEYFNGRLITKLVKTKMWASRVR